MRRLVRSIVIGVAALGLAGGSVLGFAASAGADDAFTASIQSPAAVVAGSTTALEFGGVKDSGAAITDVTVDNPSAQDLTAAACENGGAGSTSWSCTYSPTSAYVAATHSTIAIDYTNADGSSSQATIAFDVAAAPASAPAPATTPAPSTDPAPAPAPGTEPAPAPSTPLPFSTLPASAVLTGPLFAPASPAATPSDLASTLQAPEYRATIAGSTDPAFTAAITNVEPITDETSEIDFGGSKASSSELVDVEANFSTPDGPECSGTGTGSTSWSCEFDFGDDETPEPGDYSIEITEQNSNDTVIQNLLTFVIYGAEDEGQTTTPTAPEVAYEFKPASVSVISVATGGDNVVTTRVLQDGEGLLTIAACPLGANSDRPFGSNPTGSLTCTASGLDPSSEAGAYVISTEQGRDVEGEIIPSDDTSNGVIWVPENDLNGDASIPLTYTVNMAARTVTVTGSVSEDTSDPIDDSGDTAGAVDILDSTGAVVCSTQNFHFLGDSSFESFSCTTPALSYGTHVLTAAIADEGMADFETVDDALYNAGFDGVGEYVPGALSAASRLGTVNFPAPAGTTPGTTLDTNPDWSFTITGNLNDLHPGDTVTISGEGLPAGTTLDSVLHSIPTDLGTVVAAADGTFTQTVTIPQDVVPGAHTIQVTATGPGITTTTKQQPVTITAVPTSGGTTTLKPPSGVKAAGTGAGTGTQGNAAIQPNILTQALTPFADIAVHPNKVVSAIEIGLILLLLAVLPAHLLNATIAEQSDRFERRFKRFPKRPRWLTALIGWFTSAPVAAGLVVTLATAILFGFADPTFGWTLASLRLILACGIALFLVGYVANALTAVIARNQWHITVLVNTRPYGLILTIVGVLVSRLLHFSPGFLIGLILGLTIQGKSATGFAWRTVATRTSIVLLMSIAAWIGYSTLTLGGNEGGTFGTALLVETLVAITTEGVVALMVELLPLRFLEGERLYAHSRVLWGILYFLTVVVFVLAVIPWEGNWDALGSSLWIWLIVLAAFAAICVGIYVYFRRFAKPLEEEEGSEEVALGESVGGRK